MIFPKWITAGDTIGVTALSDGATKDTDKIRFNNAKSQLEEKGYKVAFTGNVFTGDDKGRSSDGKTRGEEFNSLINDTNVKAIYSAKGGDFLVEMLPYVDFENIKSNPKWIQGFSDNTSILYAITTKLDIATAYGFNFGDFGMQPWHRAVSDGLAVLEGKEKTQKSFEYYEDDFHDRITGTEGYSEDKTVYWNNLNCEKKIEISGRIIGGCMDVLLNISGTKYDGTLDFINKYKDDGIIFYLESFDLNSEELMMGLWRLRELGWFKHCTGIIFGRPMFYSSFSGMSYEEAVRTFLGDMNIPIITNADIGHKGPQFVVINGAVVNIISDNGKGRLEYQH